MAGWYNKGKAALANGTADWDTTDIRALLVRSTYAFSPDHDFVSGLTGEASGTGYARKTTTRTVVENDTNDRAELTVAGLTWTSADFGAVNGLVLYVQNASDAAAELLSYHDFTEVTTNGGDLTVSFASNNATLVS